MTSEPRQSAANREGRDELGRFVPGCAPGPGRPAVPDFRRVVAERLAVDGGSLEDALYELYQALRAEALAGNVAASKVLLDRLAPIQEEANRGPGLAELLAEAGWYRGDSMSQDERAERVRAILADAEMRREVDRQRPALDVVTWVPPAEG